ncbi:MAG: dUTP diphosphatase [Pseudomonadales bacterium]
MTDADGTAIAKLNTMAAMQDEHNQQVHPEWRTQGYAYYRAVWVECAEMLDHFGWKWWKAQAPDLEQVKLELVDIWHFALSELLRSDTLREDMGVQLNELTPASGSAASGDAEAFRQAIEKLAADSLVSQSFSLPPFIEAMQTLPMTYDELFDLYIGKNVLNRFRQDHGYKSGEYRKLWQGREDNEHLMEILNGLSVPPEVFADTLYQSLAERYEA